MFFLWWQFAFSSVRLAPLMEVSVKFKAKAYTGLHYHLYLNMGKICQRFEWENKRKRQKKTQEVTVFTFDNIKIKQYIQTWELTDARGDARDEP